LVNPKHAKNAIFSVSVHQPGYALRVTGLTIAPVTAICHGLHFAVDCMQPSSTI